MEKAGSIKMLETRLTTNNPVMENPRSACRINGTETCCHIQVSYKTHCLECTLSKSFKSYYSLIDGPTVADSCDGADDNKI